MKTLITLFENSKYQNKQHVNYDYLCVCIEIMLCSGFCQNHTSEEQNHDGLCMCHCVFAFLVLENFFYIYYSFLLGHENDL